MSVWLKVVVAIVAFIVVAGVAGWLVTAPKRLEAATVAATGPGNAEAGERIFRAAGCSSCHAAPGSKGDAQLALAGGVELNTAFGTFVTPNISPDPQAGIGKWSFADFANALERGIDPEGHYLYPAFPYPSYERMKLSDVADLFAFIKTLPPVKSDPPPNQVPFPFNIRRGIGLWNIAFLHPEPVIGFRDGTDPAILRGRYLVEGPGHCGECHTPRNAAGGTDYSQWLAGAPNPDGEGKIPNITPSKDGIGDWSAKDIAYFLETGFTPDFDTVGGSMVEVQENIAQLPASDRTAIAAYLKAIPPKPDGKPEAQEK